MTFQSGETILEKYRIEEQLGEGSFGRVYRVTYLPMLQVRALKVLRRVGDGYSDKEFAQVDQRFRMEYMLGLLRCSLMR